MRYEPFRDAFVPGNTSDLAALASADNGFRLCLYAPGIGMPMAHSWTAIYQLAFEQARIALQPSPFQRMLQPSWN